ncbi:DUF1801 domain-containing protein [Gymnodinialimonas sp. 2305UL16-5]|uniref:DUF1801 domain-containing protein n=1 Tax=Gymnodinialimonas mytili TaxID=3126503 RepID=UPI0030AA5117
MIRDTLWHPGEDGMAHSQNKTQAGDGDVSAFLASVEHPTRRADSLLLDKVFREVTGFVPKIWGDAMIGYGSYDYVYESGRSGRFLATGFSPRKANLSLYIMPGYQDFGDILSRLGKHKTGASCVYINKLADVDLDVVQELVAAGLARLQQIWSVTPS